MFLDNRDFMRVIIADDEENVCQLIKNIIDWESIGMHIVGVAHNGIEALDMIKELQPDLAITDIRMPGYDGLEMIRRAKDVKEDLEFIIISGYGHFEYAQNAIKYGVGDYLLKPIKKEELMTALDKIKRRHMRHREQFGENERLRKRLENDADELRKKFFVDCLLKKGESLDNLDLEYVNETYHYSFKTGIFQAMCVKVDCGYDDQYNGAISIIEEKITQILKRILVSVCLDIAIYCDDSMVFAILNYNPESKKQMRNHIKSVMDELMQQRAAFEQFEFTIGIGPSCEDIRSIKNSFKLAMDAVGQRLLLGTGRVIEDIVTSDTSQLQARVIANLNKSMGCAIELMDYRALLSSIDAFYNEVIAHKEFSGIDILLLTEQACDMYLSHLRNNGIPVNYGDEFLTKFHVHAWRCRTVKEVFDYLSMMIGESLKLIIEQKEQEEAKPVRLAKQYIQENYMKPLSLEEVSGIVGFSPAYFSTLFKKVSGTNFIDYLTETRINKAKELLRDTNFTIADICERVGYSDIKHFTQSFKKSTGLKPSEYRKLYA